MNNFTTPIRPFRYLIVVLLFSFSLFAGSDEGWFGVGLDVSLSGTFWSPIVKSILITSVHPHSPADSQHVSAGDSIIEIDGTPVAGAKAWFLRSKMKRKVGEAISLKLQHQNGDIYLANLTAERKPQS